MILDRIKEYVYKKRLPIIPTGENKRGYLSKHYIKGYGLEIGALHYPLPLPQGALSKKIDLVSREENIAKFPELNASEIVITDIIDDGFILSTIPDESHDFLIANHVLEHAPNPFQVLINWARVLKSNGTIFLTVPNQENCFDNGRVLTTLQHFIDDYDLYNEHNQERINERNKAHLIEWLTISEPNIFRERDTNYEPPSPSEIKKRIDESDLEDLDIHFHTFSIDSFENLVRFFTKNIDKGIRVEQVTINGSEIISVLKKKY